RALAAFGGGTAVVNRLSLVGAFFVVFIPASFSLVLALESFVGERERTTLEVLLSTPLREAEIYAGKVVAVLAVALTLCYGGLIVYCLVAFPGLGYFPIGILLALALSTICQVAAMVSGAVIISLNARTMRAANVMASFIILPMSLVLQLEAALILLGRAEFLWCFALLMTVVAIVLLRMGFSGFWRETSGCGIRCGVRSAPCVQASINAPRSRAWSGCAGSRCCWRRWVFRSAPWPATSRDRPAPSRRSSCARSSRAW